ncbi:unnamed protein product [Euphydryas editha]|uniref:Uncharacterized protein n=1 Tax=Euphydryas editha TaxID=104508 RepID=A0AAU9V0B1_EUPED|nr:unnamed protein product [Euphydryas editha]
MHLRITPPRGGGYVGLAGTQNVSEYPLKPRGAPAVGSLMRATFAYRALAGTVLTSASRSRSAASFKAMTSSQKEVTADQHLSLPSMQRIKLDNERSPPITVIRAWRWGPRGGALLESVTRRVYRYATLVTGRCGFPSCNLMQVLTKAPVPGKYLRQSEGQHPVPPSDPATKMWTYSVHRRGYGTLTTYYINSADNRWGGRWRREGVIEGAGDRIETPYRKASFGRLTILASHTSIKVLQGVASLLTAQEGGLYPALCIDLKGPHGVF